MTTFVVCGLFCLEVRYSQVVYFRVVYRIGPVNLRQMGQRTIHLKGNEVVLLRSPGTRASCTPLFFVQENDNIFKIVTHDFQIWATTSTCLMWGPTL